MHWLLIVTFLFKMAFNRLVTDYDFIELDNIILFYFIYLDLLLTVSFWYCLLLKNFVTYVT